MAVDQPNQRTERRVDGNAAWLNALLDAIVVITPHGVIQQWNEAAERMFGWRSDQAVGQLFADLCIPEEYRAAHEAGLTRWRETGVQVVIGKRLELPALRADGRRIEVELTVTLAEGWSGPVFVGFIRDITELREAQRAVETNEHRFRAIVEHSPGIISILGRDGSWRSSTTAGSRILGWERGIELEGGIFSLVHPDDLEYAMATFNEVVAGSRGPDEPVEFRVRAADGSWHWIETAADNLLEDPLVDAIVLHSRDVTERRRHDTLMAQSNERLSALVENLNAAVLVEDSDRRMAIANQQFCDLFGIPVPPAALLGSDCAAAAEQSKVLFVDPEGWLASVEAALAGGEQILDVEFGLADGRTVERDYIPIRVDDRDEGHVWIYRDVTERHEMAARRERLLEAERDVRRAIEDQNERLRELDRLKSDFVANVSHELRTPLTSIMGFAELLTDGESGGLSDEQAEYLAVIRRSSERMLALVTDLLLLSRLETRSIPIEWAEVSVPELVRESTGELSNAARTKGVLVTDACDDGPPARGDHMRLRQVLDNLVSNATKFTPEGGSVAVRATHDDQGWHIAVTDTGIGIPADEVPRLFDKFFRASNARDGNVPGTGLGLAISHAIVELHDGHLTVESVLGEGTTITVHLPA
jgi:PAS domain S-box-containing protein